jgi:dienelactone hydrolase
MRIILLLALSSLAWAADRRNTSTPNTDSHFSFTAPTEVKNWDARRLALRHQILSAAGLDPLPPRAPLNPQVTGRMVRPGYTIENVALETLPGFWVAGNLYRPTTPGPHPAVLHPHGHWNYGRLENSDNYSAPSLAITLARNGFVVFAYDMVGYNDSNQITHRFRSDAQYLWSFHPLGLQLWNGIRIADYLEKLPDVDPHRLAMTGASGGGTQTFLLTAVDDRIAVSAPVNMVSFIMQGGCVCENAPRLRLDTNTVEIAAMMAPRPMLVVAATGDWTKNVPKEEFPALQKVWALYGKTDLVEAVQIDAPHNYNKASRAPVYEFLRKHLTPNAPPIIEKGVAVENVADMLVWYGQPRPGGMRNLEHLFGDWKTLSRAQAAAATPAELRARLTEVFAISHGLPLTELPHRWLDGKGTPVLYLHPEGMAAAEASDAVKKLRAEGRRVLLVDLFQTGSARAPRDRSHEMFLGFNVTDDAARVQDVAAAVASIPGPVEIRAEGRARWWALFGAAVSENARFAAKSAEFEATDEELVADFFVPGLQRAGGVAAALRLVTTH